MMMMMMMISVTYMFEISKSLCGLCHLNFILIKSSLRCKDHNNKIIFNIYLFVQLKVTL